MIKHTVSELKHRFNLRELKTAYKGCVEVRKILSKCGNLEDIRNTKVLDYDSGLCNMLNTHIGHNCRLTYVLIETVQASWIHTTGFKVRPVKDNPNLNKWEGENLFLRKSLLNHAILCLEMALETYPSALTKEELMELKQDIRLTNVKIEPEEEPNDFYERLKRWLFISFLTLVVVYSLNSFLN